MATADGSLQVFTHRL